MTRGVKQSYLKQVRGSETLYHVVAVVTVQSRVNLPSREAIQSTELWLLVELLCRGICVPWC